MLRIMRIGAKFKHTITACQIAVAGFGSVCLAHAETHVDVELVLAVDVSYSMSSAEREIQREGYASALRSESVIRAITRGLHGKIAVTYVEWAGSASQRVVVDWTIIDGPKSAFNFAARLLNSSGGAMSRTSISGALLKSAELIEENDYLATRRVIDISGDGPNNSGFFTVEARDTVLARDIVINGLPLMTSTAQTSLFAINDLDEYYRHCVIGGPASFVIPVRRWEEFAEAVRRKLVQEIAGAPEEAPIAIPAVFHGRIDYDCLVGEKLWQRLRRRWIDE